MRATFGFIEAEKYNKRREVGKRDEWRDKYKSKKSISKQKVAETSGTLCYTGVKSPGLPVTSFTP